MCRFVRIRLRRVLLADHEALRMRKYGLRPTAQISGVDIQHIAQKANRCFRIIPYPDRKSGMRLTFCTFHGRMILEKIMKVVSGLEAAYA